MAIRPPWVLLPWPSIPPLPYSLCATHPPPLPAAHFFFNPPPLLSRLPIIGRSFLTPAPPPRILREVRADFSVKTLKRRGACLKRLMSVQGLRSDADLMWSQFEATFLLKFPVAFSFTRGGMRWPDARYMRVQKSVLSRLLIMRDTPLT